MLGDLRKGSLEGSSLYSQSSPEGRGYRVLQSRDAVTSFLPSYDHAVTFSASDAGLPDDVTPSAVPWITPPYEVRTGDVVCRLLASVSPCGVVKADSVGENAVAPFCTEGFDGRIYGRVSGIEPADDGVELTLVDPEHLVILYSKALLVRRYEAELSDRVLHDAPETAVDALDRKITELKGELQTDMTDSYGGVDTLRVQTEQDGVSIGVACFNNDVDGFW